MKKPSKVGAGCPPCGCPVVHETACPHHVHPPSVPTVPVDCGKSKTEKAPPKKPKRPRLPVNCEPFLKTVKDMPRFRACAALAKKIGPLRTAAAVDRLVGAYLCEQDQEVFLVVLCDVRFGFRGLVETALGQRSGVQVGIDDVLHAVSETHAERVFICHPHPTGNPRPSKADRRLTKAITAALKPLGNVVVCDHIIVGLDTFYSFANNKVFPAQGRDGK